MSNTIIATVISLTIIMLIIYLLKYTNIMDDKTKQNIKSFVEMLNSKRLTQSLCFIYGFLIISGGKLLFENPNFTSNALSLIFNSVVSGILCSCGGSIILYFMPDKLRFLLTILISFTLAHSINNYISK